MPLYPDILNEDCSDISDWTDNDAGNSVSEVEPTGQLRLDGNTATTPNYASRKRNIGSPPNTFSLEFKPYFNKAAIGVNTFDIKYLSSTWCLWITAQTTKLYVKKAGAVSIEIGTDIVKCNASAAWQIFRFQVDKTTESTATAEVFSKEEGGLWVSRGTVDCDYEGSFGELLDGYIYIYQYGQDTNDIVTHIDYIKIATGLGEIYGDSTSDFLQLF